MTASVRTCDADYVNCSVPAQICPNVRNHMGHLNTVYGIRIELVFHTTSKQLRDGRPAAFYV